MNDVLWNMENSEVNAFVAIDLSAAFDTMDHRILLDVLQHHFGVTGIARKWFDSYLSPRQFQVNIDKAYSEPLDLDFSVPQGTWMDVNRLKLNSSKTEFILFGS